MNYELFMGEALAEAQRALARGERPNAAVAVVDEAMVVRAHDRVQETNDPTAHAVVVALREAARKLGSVRLADATIFARRSRARCASGRCSRATSRRSCSPSPTAATGRRARSSSSPSTPSLPRRIKVVSGIRRDEAEALFAPLATG